jgi:hypothetical protein
MRNGGGVNRLFVGGEGARYSRLAHGLCGRRAVTDQDHPGDADFAPIRGVRIPYVRPCTLRLGGATLDVVICNLSAVGFYVTFPGTSTDVVPEMGATARVSFRLPDDPLPVECDAVVVLRNVGAQRERAALPPGCGLRFTSLSTGDHHRIGELVHDYRHSRHPRTAVPRPYSGLVRVSHVLPCRLAGAHGTWDGVLCNVSLTGAYVVVAPLPRGGETMQLTFVLSEAHVVDVRAEVVWVNANDPQRAESLPPGIGLRFVHLKEADRAELERLVADYDALPRPAL